MGWCLTKGAAFNENPVISLYYFGFEVCFIFHRGWFPALGGGVLEKGGVLGQVRYVCVRPGR